VRSPRTRATTLLFVLEALVAVAIATASGPSLGKPPDCIHPSRARPSDRCNETATPAEAAESAAAEREARIAADRKRRARTMDWQLLGIYPDLAIYQGKRLADLRIVVDHLRQANERLAELLEQWKRLREKLEFYKGKPLPPDLQREVQESDGTFSASADVFRGLESDIDYIVAKYNHPRERLDKLWGGAEPGSMDLLLPASSPAAK
jgi:hypothetical protein